MRAGLFFLGIAMLFVKAIPAKVQENSMEPSKATEDLLAFLQEDEVPIGNAEDISGAHPIATQGIDAASKPTEEASQPKNSPLMVEPPQEVPPREILPPTGEERLPEMPSAGTPGEIHKKIDSTSPHELAPPLPPEEKKDSKKKKEKRASAPAPQTQPLKQPLSSPSDPIQPKEWEFSFGPYTVKGDANGKPDIYDTCRGCVHKATL